MVLRSMFSTAGSFGLGNADFRRKPQKVLFNFRNPGLRQRFVGVLRANTTRGNRTQNSERKMAL